MQLAHLDADQLRVTPRALFAERAQPGALQPVLDVAVKYGALSVSPPPSSVFLAEVPH